MPAIPNPEAGEKRAIEIQQTIDGLLSIIAFDPGALGVRNRITHRIKKLRREQIEVIYVNLISPDDEEI